MNSCENYDDLQEEEILLKMKNGDEKDYTWWRKN
jgi:hypothetical protein